MSCSMVMYKWWPNIEIFRVNMVVSSMSYYISLHDYMCLLLAAVAHLDEHLTGDQEIAGNTAAG